MRKTIVASAAVLLAGAATAWAGERGSRANSDFNSIVFFSGGVPALQIRSNPENTACPYILVSPTAKAKRSKTIFAAY